MLFITKRNLSLRVYYRGEKVSITPACDESMSTQLMASLARNEELLAEGFLNITALTDPVSQLASYYASRGWEVQEIAC